MVESVVERQLDEVPELQKSQKKSFMNRLKLGKKSKKSVDSREDDSPVTREGIPVVSSMSGTHKFNPSDVRNTNKVAKGRNNTKMVVLDNAPSAKVAAFEGPPRYDWIDVVSTKPSLYFISIVHAPNTWFHEGRIHYTAYSSKSGAVPLLIVGLRKNGVSKEESGRIKISEISKSVANFLPSFP